MKMPGIGSTGDFQWKCTSTSWDYTDHLGMVVMVLRHIFSWVTTVNASGIGTRLRARARALRAHEETKVKYRRFRHWASVQRQRRWARSRGAGWWGGFSKNNQLIFL